MSRQNASALPWSSTDQGEFEAATEWLNDYPTVLPSPFDEPELDCTTEALYEVVVASTLSNRTPPSQRDGTKLHGGDS